MDSSKTRFRFRDQGMDDSTESDISEDDSLSPEPGDDESELKSMTGKGIKRLCSELLELKKASDDDFYKNVYSNYSAFVRIFKEVECLENELMELKKHISTQRKLLYDFTHGIYLEVLCEESIESIAEGTLDTEQQPPLCELETHTNTITETLDVLISECRVNEALLIFEMEPTKLERMLSQEDFPLELVMSYNSAMSERRKSLAEQIVREAEHPRIATPEFQKALSGLCRLGNCHRANLLLFQFYSSRFEDGILDLQHSKSFMYETYIRKLAKHVFSVISQAGKSSVALHGETSPYTTEFMQWAREKTEEFVSYFDKYVNSISETTGGLSMVVEAAQHAMSFCSLLESQKILLHPYLKSLILPSMERVFQMHIDHFKKVIGIFTSTDPWVPGRYLVSGLLSGTTSHVGIGGELEYCLLTNSGRKFVTVVQAIVADVLPLVSLQMENSILQGLYDLFNTYVDILIRSIPNEANAMEEGSPTTNFANTPYQQLSLLANASTLVLHLFSSVTGSISKGIECAVDETLTEQAESLQQKGIDSWILSIQEAADRLRAYFCHQFVLKVMSLQDEQILSPETKENGQSESHSLHPPLPSMAFQVLFLQLRQLEKLAREVFVGRDWEVKDLLRELMESVFFWLSNNEFWTIDGESSVAEQSSGFEKFLLDVQFIVEIARFGGFFSENLMDASLGLIEHMEMEFLAAGLNPNSDILFDGWAAKSAKAAIDKLLQIEKTMLLPVKGPVGALGEYFDEQQHEDAEDFVEEDGGRYLEGPLGFDEKSASGDEATISKLQETEKAEITTMEQSPGVIEEADCDKTTESLSNSSVCFDDPRATNSANAMTPTPIFQEMEETVGPVGTLEVYFDKKQHEDLEDFVDADSGRDSEDPVGMEYGKSALETEANISMQQDMEKAEMTTMGKPPVVNEEADCNGTARNLSNNLVYFEDPQAANSSYSMTAVFQKMEETEVPPSETSTGILMEDSDKEAAEVCAEEDVPSSCSDYNSMSDEEAANAASFVIEDNAEPESSDAGGIELVVGEDSSELGGERSRTNKAEMLIGEQQESEGVDLPAMEAYQFILDEGSDGPEK